MLAARRLSPWRRRFRRAVLIIAIALGSVTAGVLTNLSAIVVWQVAVPLFGVSVLVVVLVEASRTRLSQLGRPRLSGRRGVVRLLSRQVKRRWRDELAQRGVSDLRSLRVAWSSTPTARTVAALPAELETAGQPVLGSTSTAAADFLSLSRRQLVVIGDAGAGKSVLAALLARDLQDHRRRLQGRVPVLVTPASWRPDEEHFESWLSRCIAEDFGWDYQNSRDLVLGDRIMPILDGLDELAEAHRAQALSALDGVLGAGMPFVLTCRTEEYRWACRQAGPLTGATVVELLSIDTDQIVTYLDPYQEPRWASVRERLTEDRDETDDPLRQVLANPLMVGLASVIYRSPRSTPATLLRFPDRDALSGHLLDRFVPSVYQQPPRSPDSPADQARPYRLEKAQQWLRFLATDLTNRGQANLAWWELRLALDLRHRRILRALTGLLLGALALLLFGRFYPPGHALAIGVLFALAASRVLGIDRPVGAILQRLSRASVDFRPRTDRWLAVGLLAGLLLAAGIHIGYLAIAVPALGSAELARLVLFPEVFMIGAAAGVLLGIVAGPVLGFNAPLGSTKAYLDEEQPRRRYQYLFQHLVFVLAAAGSLIHMVTYLVAGDLSPGAVLLGPLIILLLLRSGMSISARVVFATSERPGGASILLGVALGIWWMTALFALLGQPLNGWLTGLSIVFLIGIALRLTLRTVFERPDWFGFSTDNLIPRHGRTRGRLVLRWPLFLVGAIAGTLIVVAGIALHLFTGNTSGLVTTLVALPMLTTGLGITLAVTGSRGQPIDVDAAPDFRLTLTQDRRLTITTVTLRAGLLGLIVGILFGNTSGDPWYGLLIGGVTALAAAGSIALGFAVLGSLQFASLGAISFSESTNLGVILLGLAGGLLVGLPVWAMESRGAWLSYRTSHAALALTRRLPLRLATFLEDAHARGILRRSGAYYQFRHRAIQDHLSDRPAPQPARLGPAVPAHPIAPNPWVAVRVVTGVVAVVVALTLITVLGTDQRSERVLPGHLSVPTVPPNWEQRAMHVNIAQLSAELGEYYLVSREEHPPSGRALAATSSAEAAAGRDGQVVVIAEPDDRAGTVQSVQSVVCVVVFSERRLGPQAQRAVTDFLARCASAARQYHGRLTPSLVDERIHRSIAWFFDNEFGAVAPIATYNWLDHARAPARWESHRGAHRFEYADRQLLLIAASPTAAWVETTLRPGP